MATTKRTVEVELSTSGLDAQGRPIDVTGTSVLTRGDSDFWTSVEQNLRLQAANQLRSRGAELDAATEAAVTALAGSPEMYGGAGYGGRYYRGMDVD